MFWPFSGIDSLVMYVAPLAFWGLNHLADHQHSSAHLPGFPWTKAVIASNAAHINFLTLTECWYNWYKACYEMSRFLQIR